MNEERKQQYFGELAPQYDLFTGNITQDIFAKYLDTSGLSMTNESIIHDNGAGPGTATQILVSRALAQGIFPKIIATDFSKGMVDALSKMQAEADESNQNWKLVEIRVCDSSNLQIFGDGYFTHSITNFSLFTFAQPIKSLRETFRTLKPGGIAVVSVWKRFAVQHILAAAQDIVKGSGYAAEHTVPVNGPQYFEEGYVAKEMVEAGFSRDKIETTSSSQLLDGGKYWDGILKFMTTSSVAAASTRGWTAEEATEWPKAVSQAMLEEKSRHGGLMFEAWIVTARK